MHKHVLKVLI